MKKFNINDEVLIHITEKGWIHLRKYVGKDYMKNCIEPRKKVIDNKDYYELQLWTVFDLFPVVMGGDILFETTILIENETTNNGI